MSEVPLYLECAALVSALSFFGVEVPDLTRLSRREKYPLLYHSTLGLRVIKKEVIEQPLPREAEQLKRF